MFDEEVDDKFMVTSDSYTLHNLCCGIFDIPDTSLSLAGVLYTMSPLFLLSLKYYWRGAAPACRKMMYWVHESWKAKLAPGDRVRCLTLQDVGYAKEMLESIMGTWKGQIFRG